MNTENKVTKANELVIACQNLSSAEQKLIAVLASLVQPQDEDFKPYCMKVSEFKELLGLSSDSLYEDLPRITNGLLKKVIEFRGNKRVLQVNWLSSADYKFGEGIIELEFSPKLKPFMLGLKERFTTYQLGYFLRVTGKYSQRFYEICKCYEHKRIVELKITELSEIFKLSKSYKEYQKLKDRVINPAQKELAEKTDIMFDYEPVKARTGKKVVAIKFHIRANHKDEPKKALQEPLALPETTASNQTDIQDVKAEFKRLYGGELVDRFVSQMITEKGLEHVWQCLRMYADYISGRSIKNVAGDFFRFVTKGYQKPTAYKGNIPQRDNFEQREYDDEELEKYYADLTPEKDCSDKSKSGNSRITEVGENNLKSIKQILTPG